MRPDEKYLYARSFPVHVGVDTGKAFHVLVARGPDGRRKRPHKVLVGREGFEAAHAHLRSLFPDIEPSRMLVGLEFAGHHGFTFAHFLKKKGYAVVSVLPAHTKKAKEIEDNSPEKNDRKDAALICKLVGDGTFVPFPFLREPYTSLKLLVMQRHRLTVEENRFKNRLQSILDLAWPEFMGHFSFINKKTPLALLERWPLPEDLARADARSVRRFIRSTSRGQIGPDKIRANIESARESVGLKDGSELRRLEIQHLLGRWKLNRTQKSELDERIAALVERCPEAKALTSVPEVSTLSAAVIVAELGTPETYEHPRQILKLAGMNLVGSTSGTSVYGRRWQSKRGRPMLRRQLFLIAGRWCGPRGLYREDYQRMLERNGRRRTKAVAAIARKLVPVLFRVMKTGEPFDRERFLRNRYSREEAVA